MSPPSAPEYHLASPTRGGRWDKGGSKHRKGKLRSGGEHLQSSAAGGWTRLVCLHACVAYQRHDGGHEASHRHHCGVQHELQLGGNVQQRAGVRWRAVNAADDGAACGRGEVESEQRPALDGERGEAACARVCSSNSTRYKNSGSTGAFEVYQAELVVMVLRTQPLQCSGACARS
jgi:hypothetical protein